MFALVKVEYVYGWDVDRKKAWRRPSAGPKALTSMIEFADAEEPPHFASDLDQCIAIFPSGLGSCIFNHTPIRSSNAN